MKFFVRNKRGSLSLSMEAIVVLIIAVVMLGLALTFVRGLFNKMGPQALGALEIGSLRSLPTEEQPVTITPSNMDAKEGTKQTVIVGFYNPSVTKTNWIVRVIDPNNPDVKFCSSTDKCYGDVSVLYGTTPYTIEKSKTVAGSVIFDFPNGAVCQIVNDCDKVASASALFRVEICSVDAGATGQDTCPEGSEVYYQDLPVTIRK